MASKIQITFDASDPDLAEELAGRVAEEGAPRWKLNSIMADLIASLEHVQDPDRRRRLEAVIEQLKA